MKTNAFTKSAMCNSEISKFIKQQEASGLALGHNSPFTVIPIIGSIL